MQNRNNRSKEKLFKQGSLATHEAAKEIAKFCMQFAAVPNSRTAVVELQVIGNIGSIRRDQIWFCFNLWFLSKHLGCNRINRVSTAAAAGQQNKHNEKKCLNTMQPR